MKGARSMVKIDARPAGTQDEIRARLASYRRDVDALNEQRDELINSFPEQWVAIHEGKVYHAAELDALFAQLRLAGVEPARVPREFLTKDEPALLL